MDSENHNHLVSVIGRLQLCAVELNRIMEAGDSASVLGSVDEAVDCIFRVQHSLSELAIGKEPELAQDLVLPQVRLGNLLRRPAPKRCRGQVREVRAPPLQTRGSLPRPPPRRRSHVGEKTLEKDLQCQTKRTIPSPS